MRDYGIVSPRFWIGDTGRQLRKHPYAQRVAMYLLTAPGSDMTGVFYCPVAMILNDVGSPFEDPSKGYELALKGVKEALKTLSSLGFCFYDFDSEFVFVREMARWQIAEKLKPSDNRVKGVLKYVESMPEPLRARFVARYNEDFSLGFAAETIEKMASPLEAPSEPHRSQEQEQEQEQDIYTTTDVVVREKNPEDFLSPEIAPEEQPKNLKQQNCPTKEIVEAYNAKLGPYLGQVKKMTAARSASVRARWLEIIDIVGSQDKAECLQGVDSYFNKIARSDFLMGRIKGKGWKADFDFIFSASGFTKIYEGKYENGRRQVQ